MENKKIEKNIGKITQITGSVVVVDFPENLPEIYNALNTKVNGKDLVLEVEQHIGFNKVKALAMGSSEGLQRGQEVIDTGSCINVPVGKEVLGRMFNALGEVIDGIGDFKGKESLPIHRPAPKFIEQSTEVEILETGIKVIDLICPVLKGGKIGLFGGA